MSELDDLRMRLAALETEVDRLRKESAASRTGAAMAGRGGAKAARTAKAHTSPRGRAQVEDETSTGERPGEREAETGQAMTCLAEALGVLGAGRVRQVEVPQTQVLRARVLQSETLRIQTPQAETLRAEKPRAEKPRAEGRQTEVPQDLTPALEPQDRTPPQHGRFLDSLLAGQSALFEEKHHPDTEP
ncbi:hypothetical protein ACFV84_34665 [Kitasatospora sp. NPDC059811]|uniref:hypothetical protein n=1 Tax=Streptomycetaceae TaxID=2062 RepID=UPI0007AFCB81|nr:hypothetical protein [Streptomyces sp. MJM8645]